jgi:hypothetical protein
MKNKSPFALALVALLSVAIVVPADLAASPDTPGQKAGEVSRLIPAVSIARGAKTINAAVKTPVNWEDLVNTQANGRARIALDDGSVLNVGSDSSMKIVKHDAGAQQTQLELAYGKLRTQAQKIAKPDGKFEVKTAAGVAGVVGTDFYVEYANNVMNVVAYEGLVRVCNTAGVCVLLKAGQITTLRNGDNSPPAPPTQASLDLLVTAGKDTEVNPPPVGGDLGGAGKGFGITTGIFAAGAVAIFAVIASRHSKATPPPVTCPPSQCG